MGIGKKQKDPLLVQFREWAKSLLKVNPDYVKDPGCLIPYIKGPNWDAPDVEYAHYKHMISLYGNELLELFERLRTLEYHDACEAYKKVLWESDALKKEYDDLALKRAEEIGVIEYKVNGNLMEYWSFFGNEGFYFIRHDLDSGKDVFRGANIPWNGVIPAFLMTETGATLYNYMEG